MRRISALTLIACCLLTSSCQSIALSGDVYGEGKDSDGDNIDDAFDLCPNSKSTKYLLPNGCQLRSLHNFFREPIGFRFLDPTIHAGVIPSLQSDLKYLKENDRVHVVITGYNKTCEADPAGERLALERAKSIWRYYVKNGLDPERILWVKGTPSKYMKFQGVDTCRSDLFDTVQVQYAPW